MGEHQPPGPDPPLTRPPPPRSTPPRTRHPPGPDPPEQTPPGADTPPQSRPPPVEQTPPRQQTPPLVNRMTDRCKNITLATTSLRPVITVEQIYIISTGHIKFYFTYGLQFIQKFRISTTLVIVMKYTEQDCIPVGCIPTAC